MRRAVAAFVSFVFANLGIAPGWYGPGRWGRVIATRAVRALVAIDSAHGSEQRPDTRSLVRLAKKGLRWAGVS